MFSIFLATIWSLQEHTLSIYISVLLLTNCPWCDEVFTRKEQLVEEFVTWSSSILLLSTIIIIIIIIIILKFIVIITIMIIIYREKKLAIGNHSSRDSALWENHLHLMMTKRIMMMMMNMRIRMMMNIVMIMILISSQGKNISARVPQEKKLFWREDFVRMDQIIVVQQLFCGKGQDNQ